MLRKKESVLAISKIMLASFRRKHDGARRMLPETPRSSRQHCSSTLLFQIAPVGPEGKIGDEWNIELDHAFHLRTHQRANLFCLVEGHFEEQFVMHLQNHARLEIAFCQLAIERDHRQLNQIGSCALQRRIDGRTLGKAALVGVATLDVRNRSQPSEERAYKAIFPRLRQRLFDERFYTFIPSEVALDISFRFRLRNAKLRRQSEGGDAIDDTEVHGLGAIARLLVHGIDRDAEDLTSRERVDVDLFGIGAHQQRIATEMREQPQLNLRVVGGKELCAGPRNEGCANLAPQFRAHWNILQIRIDGGEPSRSRRRSLKGRVYARL